MPDCKSLYFSLFRAIEDAISLLIEAQRSAEELLRDDEENIVLLPQTTENESQKQVAIPIGNHGLFVVFSMFIRFACVASVYSRLIHETNTVFSFTRIW